MKRVIGAFLLLLGLAGAGFCLFRLAAARGEAQQLALSAETMDAFFAAGGGEGFVSSAYTAEPAVKETVQKVPHQFVAPEGFHILSFSGAWDEEKLALLYEELMQNRHGEEIYTLQEVLLYGHEDDYAAATHSAETDWLEVRSSFPALPKGFVLWFARDTSVITLYGGDVHTTVESLAGSLSHEYGHLYTFYYLFGGETTLGNTEYAALRDSVGQGLVTQDHALGAEDYRDNHHRYLIEVAAEDYVQLMGSPATRQTADYKDVRQEMYGAEQPDDETYYTAMNAWPQENMTLPLASEVPGLAELFYRFLDEEPPNPLEERKEIVLEINKRTVGHDLVGGYRNFTHYVLTWNTPYAEAVYTVACYDPEDYDYARPIKTVWPGQDARAVVGTVTREAGNLVHYYYDDLDQGNKVFYVTALLPDGTYYLSERLTYSFG